MKQSKVTTFVGLLFVNALVASLCFGAVNIQKVQGARTVTVGLWHLDEVAPDGYSATTPDAIGYNHGTVGGNAVLVEGKFGKALQCDISGFVYVPIAFLVGFPPTPEPIYIPVSQNLDIQKDLRIEAWINVQGFTNASYNNIVVKCTRTGPLVEDVTRVFGLAIKPSPEQKDQGVLSGCVHTNSGGFNEILTTEPVISLNKWINVAFTRTATGMHLYVDGEEQDVTVIDGVKNPEGSILNGTEIYIGHDSEITIDEVEITDLAPEAQILAAQIDVGSNLLIAIIVAVVVIATAWVLRKAIQMWVIYSKGRD